MSTHIAAAAMMMKLGTEDFLPVTPVSDTLSRYSDNFPIAISSGVTLQESSLAITTARCLLLHSRHIIIIGVVLSHCLYSYRRPHLLGLWDRLAALRSASL